jgi:hypothetical protein
MITTARANRIREAYRANERAREAFDPKRYKRGGGYTPAEIRSIERMAGVKKPTNAELSKLEIHDIMRNPPEKLFVYYDKEFRHVSTWMGDVVGTIVQRGRERRPMGGRVVSVRVRAINGYTYLGTCNLSSGSYCRLRRSTRWR